MSQIYTIYNLNEIDTTRKSEDIIYVYGNPHKFDEFCFGIILIHVVVNAY